VRRKDSGIPHNMKDFGRILVLIDDTAELAQAAPLFSQLPEGWKVTFSQTPADALYVLDQVPFDIVFVDLKAGPLASTQFLHEVWARYPKTIRFLLAANMEPDLMVTCALGPHQFLQKPIDASAVRGALDRATLVDRLFREPRVQNLVSRIRTFPSRPTVYVEVMRELRSSDSSPQVVGELVSRDLAISSKLLQITNSAFFGFSQRVSSPAEAVLLLGMETTASLVLGIEAFARLDNVKLLYFSTDQVWKHSQAVANSARAIADAMTNDASIAHDAFTGALLHDIGKLALAVNFEDQYRQALNEAREKNVPAWEIEKEMFGATHAEVGAYLLSLWGLPASVIEAVASHHLPSRELPTKFSPLTAVHLANALDYAESSGQSGFPEFRLDLDYPAELHLQENLEELREIARTASRPADSSTTQIVRKKAVERPSISSQPAVQLAANLSPNGWWSRFRSLLAA
jgi:putative nucleotidyltransferase with HDIG domain